ncbi:hypothetical protein PT285_00760 [Lactobacillus sp. ESL0791]|uniref:hypothetical protein n=1 Tax=Lactobacillus sp. ESL0791 TaxID=2983234 RepID=UPI0023F8AF39|nr:hypothetical protein [Lactobacillus sp. ESL0791]MDF7637968.1 hypothetical protein [Lactobacillus sp. ESL0791]
MAVNNSRLFGSNRFSSNIGNFTMRQAPTINYDLSTVMGSIKYLGSQKGRKFAKHVGSKNSLKVTTRMSKISIN